MTQASLCYRPLTTCVVCDAGQLEMVLDLGAQPPANQFLTREQGTAAQNKFPLALCRCRACGHFQISVAVDGSLLFSDYSYVSGTTQALEPHAKRLIELIKSNAPNAFSGALLEIGSNDGSLLTLLREHFSGGVLGVDPAANLATVARSKGLDVVVDFFGPKIAKRLCAEQRSFATVLGRHVFAHLPEPRPVLGAMAEVLDRDGIVMIEVPHVWGLFENTAFDTIYHEHISFFSATALQSLGRLCGLTLCDLLDVPMHGGSFVATFRRPLGKDQGPVSSRVTQWLVREAEHGLLTSEAAMKFANRARKTLEGAKQFLREEQRLGRTTWGYGASAKAQVLLNAIDAGPNEVGLILDRSPFKAGRLSPGTNIPVEDPDRLPGGQHPDNIVVFAWNLIEEIAPYLRQAFPEARLVTLVPEVRIIHGS